MQPIESFEALIQQLEEENLPFRKAEEKDTLTVPTRLGEEQSVLHIRWEPVPGVIQFVQMLPVTVPEHRRDRLAVLIGSINVSLPILGFTMNPENGVVAYRTHAFLGKEKEIAPGVIGAVIASAVRITKIYLPQLKKAVSEDSMDMEFDW
jgi:hypothetical protein